MFVRALRAEVDEVFAQRVADVAERVLGNANAARLANQLQMRRDVHSVARQSAVTVLDDVSKVHANAKNDALFGAHAGVALDEAGLNLDGRMHRFDDAAEFRDEAVAVAFGDAAAVRRNGRIYKIAAQGARQSRARVRFSSAAAIRL